MLIIIIHKEWCQTIKFWFSSLFYYYSHKITLGHPTHVEVVSVCMFNMDLVQIDKLMEQANTIVVTLEQSIAPTTSHNNHRPCSWNTWSITCIVVFVPLNTIVDAIGTKSTFQQHVVVWIINPIHSSVCQDSHLVILEFGKDTQKLERNRFYCIYDSITCRVFCYKLMVKS